jgi:ABC-type glycerol-3-phosphate transport system substrate-binding protein
MRFPGNCCGRRHAALMSVAMLVLCTVFSACGGSSSGEQPVDIVFVTYRTDYYTQLAEAFHAENPDIRVHVRYIRDLADGASPDSVWADPGFSRVVAESGDVVPIEGWFPGVNLYHGIRQGLLYDLRPFLDEEPEIESLFIDQTIDAVSWQGGVYGLPWSFSEPLMLYNKQLFDEAGVPEPAVGWTWDSLLQAARTLTEAERGQFGFVDTTERTGLVPLALVAQSGTQLIGSSGDVPAALLDEPAVAVALEWYVDLAATYHVMPTPLPGDVGVDTVCLGLAGTWSHGLSSSAGIDSAGVLCAPGAVAPWPRGEVQAQPLIVDAFGISAGTAHPGAAWRWLAFLGQQPVGSGFPEWSALKSELDRPTLALDRGITQEAADAVRAAVADAVPMQLEYGALRSVIAGLAEVFEGQETVAGLLQEAARAQAGLGTPGPVVVDTPVPATTEPDTVIVFVPGRDLLGGFEDPRSYEALLEEFERENPDIGIEVRTFSSLMLDNQIAKQSDVFLGAPRVPSEQPEENEYTILVMDVGPFIDADTSFDSEGLLDTAFLVPPGYPGSAQWGVPVAFDALGMFYDTEKMQAAGVADPDADWEWDDLRLAAAQLTVDMDGSVQYGYLGRVDAVDLELFLLGRGLVLPADIPGSSDQPEALIEDQMPELREALAWWVNLAREDGIMAPIGSSFFSFVDDGRAAIWADHLGDVGSRRDPLYAAARSGSWDLGFAPMPRGEYSVAAIRYSIAYVSADTRHGEACWKWVRFLSEHLPPGSKAPARWALLESEAFAGRVGTEMQSAYVQVAESYGQADAVVDREAVGSPFLFAFLQEIEDGASVDAALAEARLQVGW